jgi:hypothetical protein
LGRKKEKRKITGSLATRFTDFPLIRVRQRVIAVWRIQMREITIKKTAAEKLLFFIILKKV